MPSLDLRLRIASMFVTSLAIIGFGGRPATAQEQSGDQSWQQEVSLQDLLDPQITTASRTAEKATEAPATVYVISKDDIRSRGYSTLADVLRDLPGMEVEELYYSEQGTLVPVRGVVGNNKIVLLINGMRVNPPGGEELMIRSDVSVRFAEQIEIIYGPGSTLYGQDAISAVINIRTKKPAERATEALAAYGNNNTKEGFASFAQRFRERSETPITVSGFASFRDSDLSDLSKSYPLWWKKFDDYLAMSNRAGPPTRRDLGYSVFGRIETKNSSLQVWYRQSRRSTGEGDGEGGITPVLYFVPEARWQDRSLVAEGQNVIKLGHQVDLRSIATFNRYEISPASRYVFPDGMGGVYLQDFKYGIGTSVSLEEKADWDPDENTHVVAGVVATHYDIIPKASVLGGADPSGDVVAQAGTLTYYTAPNDPSSRVDLHRAVDLHYRQLGVYAEGSRRFLDHLKVIAGLRIDANSRYSQVPFSPRAAVVYNSLENRLTLKYIYSMAYVAPAPYFEYNVFDNGSQISAGNLKLKPERSVSNEVNATWKAHSLLLSLSGYFNHQSDLLITAQSEAPETLVAAKVYVNPDGTGERIVRHSINLGTSDALGLDASMRYALAHRLSAWASYSLVDFHRTLGAIKSGLDQISRHNVRAGFVLDVLPNLSLTPSLVLRSTPENLGPSYAIPGADMKTPYEVNLNALYAPMKNLDVFVTIRNLTNHHYMVRGVAGPNTAEPTWGFVGLRASY